MTGTRLVTRGVLTALVAGTIALAGCGSSGSDAGSDAKSSTSGTVKLENAWSRATAASATNGVVYGIVSNDTDERVTLTGASVPADIAMEAQLHETTTEATSDTSMGDMSTSSTTIGDMAGGSTSSTTMGNMGGEMKGMREVSSFVVKPHSEFKFESGGNHIMLIGLKKQLMAGDTFTVTLHRKGGADLTAKVTVKDA